MGPLADVETRSSLDMRSLPIQRLSSQSTSNDVTAKLISAFKKLISEGTFIPGCKLPPERDLARQFGVNRSSLRQALKVLQIMGVLFQRVGDGTYLSDGAADMLHEPMEFLRLVGDISDLELFEARLIVESELAARAAERADETDLAALRRAIRAMENSRSNQQRIQADIAFHEAIFRASGNRVCQFIFSVIHRVVLESMAKVAPRMRSSRPLSFHKHLYAAIAHGKPGEARRVMAAHLLDARSFLVSAAKKSSAASLLAASAKASRARSR